MNLMLVAGDTAYIPTQQVSMKIVSTFELAIFAIHGCDKADIPTWQVTAEVIGIYK